MHFILINSICILGLVGFLIATYIYGKKKSKKKLVCPRYSNCDTVIHSDYSKLFGIRVEVLGMIYYLFIGSVYSIVFVANAWSATLGLILVSSSMCAVLFSIYLVSIQAFVLKHWCVWCLSSAFISILIFILSYIHLGLY